jgi:hypothetical protein
MIHNKVIAVITEKLTVKNTTDSSNRLKFSDKVNSYELNGNEVIAYIEALLCFLWACHSSHEHYLK